MKVKDIIACSEWVPSRRSEQTKPLVSVLLPTFRRGATGLFMKAALSVLNQSLSELELIIVDDASIDGTADQIRELLARDDRVSCLRHPENIGLPAVSEYEAFRRARADYLAFAFDDDEFYPHALQDLLSSALKKNSSIVHGYVDIHLYDEAAKQSIKVPNFGREGMPQSMLTGSNYLSNNAVMLHRRVIDKVGFYDPHVAISRLCDWDLWRRISRCFDLTAVDVSVGQVFGPSTGDSLGHTHGMEYWQVMEWMNLPRNRLLLPENFSEYDVLEIPDGLTRQTKRAIEEISENFKNKFWYPKKTENRYFSLAGLGNEPLEEDGRILVVTPSHDASTTLCFDHLPPPYYQRIRIIHFQLWLPEEMIGASAVIFVRDLLSLREWIEYARKLKIPHYYFLDDNLMLLSEEPAYSAEYRFFTNENVCETLKLFSGVLLSSQKLLEYFRENNLHDHLFYYPPIAECPILYEKVGPGPKADKVFRIAYLGGGHRHQSFKEMVFPAICRFARNHAVELFVGGMSNDSLKETEKLSIYYLPFEISYDLALGRFACLEIDLLVHPNSRTGNNPYKTLNVLINTVAMKAVPLLSDNPPYDTLGNEKVAFLCHGDEDSWLEAIQTAFDQPETIKTLKNNLELFCRKNYNGQANIDVLRQILQESPSPGPVLRDRRFRKFIEILRHQHSPPEPQSPVRVFLKKITQKETNGPTWRFFWGPIIRRLRRG
jgi:glycosyltransferase involved in cell wall biosynthesis